MSGYSGFMGGGAPKVTPIRPWLTLCQTTKSGPIPNLFNVLLALRNDPAFTGTFGYDEMLRAPVAMNPNPHPVEDVTVIQAQEWMQQNGIRRCPKDTARDAIEIVAREHPFHPLKDTLSKLQWDGKPRLAYWLRDYLGADDTDYHSQTGRCFLISMIARIFQPGCKVDYMLVLEGEQGTLKSQAAETLACGYFSDTLPDLGGDAVRLSMHLRGKWLIEVSELSAFSRAEAARLKAFLTTKIEQFTPKFGRAEVSEPRQCVFIGTTNKATYLRDETGGRRFWPVKCTNIDIAALARDRDQLLAEALDQFHKGEHWWPANDFEDSHAKPVQQQRYQGDAWETLIEDWDQQVPETDANGNPQFDVDKSGSRTPRRVAISQPFYLHQIAAGALAIQPNHLTKATEMRLATTLEAMGWARAEKTRRGRPWNPPVTP